MCEVSVHTRGLLVNALMVGHPVVMIHYKIRPYGGCLCNSAFTYLSLSAENIVFQHDNDLKHTAKIVKNWLKTQPFHIMKWPAQYPDMNPMENVWSHIKSKFANIEIYKRDAPSLEKNGMKFGRRFPMK